MTRDEAHAIPPNLVTLKIAADEAWAAVSGAQMLNIAGKSVEEAAQIGVMVDIAKARFGVAQNRYQDALSTYLRTLP